MCNFAELGKDSKSSFTRVRDALDDKILVILTSNCSDNCDAFLKMRPLKPSFTNSPMLYIRMSSWISRLLGTYHEKSRAQTGNPQPNMSTIFIGKSIADELACKQMPTSAEPVQIH